MHLKYQFAKKELVELATFLKCRTESCIIVGGDLNVSCTQAEREEITKGNILTGQQSGPISDFLKTTKLAMGRYVGNPTTKGSKIFDYVFTTFHDKIELTTVLDDVIISDHYAVMMTLNITRINQKMNKYISAACLSKFNKELVDKLNTIPFNETTPKSLTEAQDWHLSVKKAVLTVTQTNIIETKWSLTPTIRRNGFWFTGEILKQWKNTKQSQNRFRKYPK